MYKIFLFQLAFLVSISLQCNNSNDVNALSASGTLEAQTLTISAKVAGQISKLRVDESSRVNRGDTLLLIDDENYRLQLAQAEAALEIAGAQLALLQKGARKEDLEQASALLRQAEINFEAAEKDFNRINKLFEKETISQKQFDDASNRLLISKSQFIAATENFTKLKSLVRPEELRQAEAKLKQAVAARDILKKSVNDCVVTAPSDGIISKRYFNESELVLPMASLFKLIDLKKVNLMIYVSETELPKIKLGQKAEITIDAFDEKKYEGNVVFISPEAEFTPKNIQTKDERAKLVFAVKIEIKNDSMELKSGLPADALIKLQ